MESLVYISSLPILSYYIAIPLIIGCLKWKFVKKELPLFFLFICITFLSETSFFYTSEKRINNHLLINFDLIIAFIILTIAYHNVFKKSRIKKTISWVSIIILSICCINLLSGDIQTYRLWNGYLINTFLFITSAYYLTDFLRKENQDYSILREPHFWFSSGLLISFSSSIILFSLLGQISNNTPVETYFNGLHITINILSYTMYSIAFLCCSHQKETNAEIYSLLAFFSRGRIITNRPTTESFRFAQKTENIDKQPI